MMGNKTKKVKQMKPTTRTKGPGNQIQVIKHKISKSNFI